MPRFKYKGRNQNGQAVTGFAEADSQALLKEKLRENGVWLIRADVVRSPWSWPGAGDRIKPLELAMFTKQMAVLLNSGVPLISALHSVQEGASPRFKPVILRIIEEIKSGQSYSKALALYPKIFSPFFLGMIEVGEASSLLGEMHLRLNSHLEQNMDLRKKILTASIYPFMVLMSTVLAVCFILVYAFPKIADIYRKSKVELPLLTKVMIGISSFLVRQWYIPVGLLLFLVVLIFGFRIHRRPPFNRWLDRFILKVPIYSRFYRQIVLSRFTHNLALLLNSGITIIKSLEIVKNLLNNSLIQSYLDQTIVSIQNGENFAAYLRRNKFFPSLLVSLIRTGEQSGELPEMMEKASEFFAKEVEDGVKQFTALLEPVLILVSAGTVFLVLLAFYIPLFKMFKVAMHH